MKITLPRRAVAAAATALLVVGGASLPLAVAAPPAPADPIPADPIPVETPGESESVKVVVMMASQPAAPSLDAERANISEQKRLLDGWSQTYGLRVDRQFGYLVNGFSATMPADSITALALEPQVQSVRRERVYEPVDEGSREAQGIPAAFADYGADGTGTVISIIDTGVDATHQDMRLDEGTAGACPETAKIRTINPQADGRFSCKVPDGYNYADESFVVKDTTSSQHGMHVAGIAAANGAEGPDSPPISSGRVDGVAPNAQILAMKVFSNTGGGAQDSDIIAAIEDSVKKHADVMNLSLGSDNGMKDASDGTARAIEKAREGGAVVVISAGNSGQSFSPTGVADDVFGRLDDGAIGSPGVEGTAFTVASIDNTSVIQPLAYYDDGTEHPVAYLLQTGTPDGAGHPLVDVGLGRAQDYAAGQDLKGAFALVERGEIAFSEKFAQAQAHGAGGIVVFNSAAGGDALAGMAGVDDYTWLSAFLGRSDGLKIREALAKGPVSIRFTGDLDSAANPTALEPSSFTSWGTTPTLDFEPEIAGIGGSVYSTLNDGQYGTKSGTSMAAPNVSGMSALLMGEFATRYPELSPAERVDLVTTALMNTAQTPMIGDVPAAPRQIGAGLGRADLALRTTVTARVDGQASAALREVNAPRTFTVTLTNRGDAPVSYTVPAQQVINESNTAGTATTTSISSESLTASADEVTVPAHGEATVSFTLSPATGSAHFIEGWARLASATDGQPDLAVPYLGFVGDWNAEPIIAAPGTSSFQGYLTGSVANQATTRLMMAVPGGVVASQNASTGARSYWLSPNGDGYFDSIVANLSMQRNATEATYSIVRADGTEVKTLGMENGLRREILGDALAATSGGDLVVTGHRFDGTVWDPQSAQWVPVPDGEYAYRVTATLGGGFAPQTLDLPFGVDTTAPVITFGERSGRTLPFTVVETGSGLAAAPTARTAAGTALRVTTVAPGSYTVQVPDGTVGVVVEAMDRGFTEASAATVLTATTLVVPDENTLKTGVVGPTSPQVEDGQLVVRGYVSADIASVTVGGADAPIQAGGFVGRAPLTEGANEIAVVGFDAAGTEVARRVLTPTYDATAPVLTITNLDAAGQVPLSGSRVTVTGTIADERAGAATSVVIGSTPATVAADGSFTGTATVSASATTVTVKASDGANTVSRVLPIAGRAPAPDAWRSPTFTNADCTVAASASCFVAGDTPDASEDGRTFTIRGTAGPGTRSIVFTPSHRDLGDGAETGAQPIAATISPDGTFEAALPVSTGQNHFRYEVRDDSDRVRVDMSLRVYYDVTAPTVEFDEPTLIGGTLYTSSDRVRFAGTASDDGWGYWLGLNDSAVEEVFYLTGLGPESNQRSFSADVDVADGDSILVYMYDQNGNTLVGLVPVVLDAIAPMLSIDGVTEGERLTEPRTVTATAEDPHLATLTVSVDGETVSVQATDLVTQTSSVQDVFVGTRQIPADGSEGADGAVSTPESLPSDVADGTVAETADVAPTAPEQTTLSAQVDTSTLAPGVHTLTAESRDLAGNITAQAVTFTVLAPLAIAGPDAATVEVPREMLEDQDALGAEVLAQYSAQLGGEDAGDAASLAIVAGAPLHEGENAVTIRATDADGQSADRQVSVTVTLQTRTLSDEGVTATSTFRSDDTLDATITPAADGRGSRIVLTNDPAFASLDAVITVPGAKNARVDRVMPDGTQVPVAVTWADGQLSFTGPVKATYQVIVPTGPVDPWDPSDPGPQRFVDVPPGSMFYAEIQWLAASGITTGWADGTYRPTTPINRDAMAAFLYRMAGSPAVTAPSTQPFSDVRPGQEHYDAIMWAYQTGITTGYADGTFRPTQPIARDAMAAFIYRYAGKPAFPKPTTAPFVDVPADSQFATEIAWAKSNFIAKGWPDGTYQPLSPMNRDAMAAFLYRLAVERGITLGSEAGS